VKKLAAFSMATVALWASSPGAHGEALSGTWACVVEQTAGITFSERSEQGTAHAIDFGSSHKHFLLKVAVVERTDFQRQFCRQTLEHWSPILQREGHFDPTDKPFTGASGHDASKMYDMRSNIGPNCFATMKATVKFFGHDFAASLFSYDFIPNEFQGVLPGQWLALYSDGKRFRMGETLDAGPIVTAGVCERAE
jgi:hypothetical protein